MIYYRRTSRIGDYKRKRVSSWCNHKIRRHHRNLYLLLIFSWLEIFLLWLIINQYQVVLIITLSCDVLYVINSFIYGLLCGNTSWRSGRRSLLSYNNGLNIFFFYLELKRLRLDRGFMVEYNICRSRWKSIGDELIRKLIINLLFLFILDSLTHGNHPHF